MSEKLKVLEFLQPPFRYDSYGQMIFDKNNNLVLDVRAWGMLQYKENGEQLQDSFGKFVANSMNKSLDTLKEPVLGEPKTFAGNKDDVVMNRPEPKTGERENINGKGE